MVVVFLDGVDGTGKTTLLHGVANHPELDRPVVVVPPLWRYLPSVPTPAAFATWVTTTEPARIAAELLTGQRQRIDAIGAATAAPTTVVLVDRGPKTVEASARAHLRTGTTTAVDATLTAFWTELRRAVTALAANHPCLSIELNVNAYATILHRLTDHDRHNPAYLKYLNTFLHYFHTTADIDGVRALRLDATAPAEHSADAAVTAIHALGTPDY